MNKYLANCEAEKPFSVPKSLKYTDLGEVGVDDIKDFKFIDKNIGYVLGVQNFGGYVNIFKTENGGKNWRDLKVGIETYPHNFHFLDKNNGFISVYAATGCPNKCVYKSVLYATKNGGETWERREYPNFEGMLYEIVSDSNKNLYAVLLSQNEKATILKSIDNGITWNTFYTSDNLNITSIKSMLQIFNDNLYVNSKNGNIIKISNKGELLKTIQTNQKYVNDLKIVSNDTLYVGGYAGLYKSFDGGNNWILFNKGWSDIINLRSGKKSYSSIISVIVPLIILHRMILFFSQLMEVKLGMKAQNLKI